MPRKKKTPVVTPGIDLPQDSIGKLIPGPMDNCRNRRGGWKPQVLQAFCLCNSAS
jgi:hypothetical protein